MESEKKELIIPTADDDSTSEISDMQTVDAFEMARIRMKDITENISNVLQVGQAVADSLRPAFENLGAMIIKAEQVAVAMKPMLDMIQQISASFSETIANISIPTISAEEKQELLESQQQWGKLGWTWFTYAPVNFYNDPPIDTNSAYSKVKPFCTVNGLEQLFEELRKKATKKSEKSDLDSAIFCYQNRQYKACSLLLFGIIESKLIREMPKPRGKAKRRPVGASAVKTLKEKADQSEKDFFMVMHIANLFACLETFFANGDDFKCEPPTINRNFIGHGMNRRNVRKRDCIQLFLVLQNLQLYQKFAKR